MSNSVNNKLLNTQSNNRPAQVYDINLNSDLISSLQESINSLSGQLNSTDSEPSIPPEESILDTPLPISNETTTSRGGNKRTSSTSSNSSSSVITRRDKPNPTTDGLAKRTYVPGADKSVKPDDQPVSQVPAIQIPFLERQPIGSETTLGNGTTITTTKNDDGTTTETIVSSTGTITKTYEDFPLDKKGNPTGFRTTIVNNNYEVTILSTVINDLGDGTFSTVTTDITDPSNPFHVMSSALKKNSDAKDQMDLLKIQQARI